MFEFFFRLSYEPVLVVVVVCHKQMAVKEERLLLIGLHTGVVELDVAEAVLRCRNRPLFQRFFLQVCLSRAFLGK